MLVLIIFVLLSRLVVLIMMAVLIFFGLVVMETWLMRMLVMEVDVDVDGVWLEMGILVEKEHSVNQDLVGESG